VEQRRDAMLARLAALGSGHQPPDAPPAPVHPSPREATA
jgi:hypothetical protein